MSIVVNGAFFTISTDADLSGQINIHGVITRLSVEDYPAMVENIGFFVFLHFSPNECDGERAIGLVIHDADDNVCADAGTIQKRPKISGFDGWGHVVLPFHFSQIQVPAPGVYHAHLKVDDSVIHSTRLQVGTREQLG